MHGRGAKTLRLRIELKFKSEHFWEKKFKKIVQKRSKMFFICQWYLHFDHFFAKTFETGVSKPHCCQACECQNEVGLKNMQIRPKQCKNAEVCKINVVSSLRKLLIWFFLCSRAELFLFRYLFTDLVLLNATNTKSDKYYRENKNLKLGVNCV